MQKDLANFKDHFRRQERLHTFRVVRTYITYAIFPIWILFSVIDFLYMPELWGHWAAYRLVTALPWLFLPMGLRSRKLRPYIIRFAPAFITVSAANAVNAMIWQSGGAESLYIAGVILVTVCGIQIFRMKRIHALCVNLLCYLPTVAVLCAQSDSINASIVSSSLLIGMTLLTYIFHSSDELLLTAWAMAKESARREAERNLRSDFLKKHFPPKLREQIEKSGGQMQKCEILPSAVVGFADITSSTLLTNKVDLRTDWEVKERFLEIATRSATANNMVVLAQTGDGFLFLANYYDGNNWTYNLISFFETIFAEFRGLLNDYRSIISDLDTGLRCGVAMGPCVLGFIGKEQSYFTIMGSTVNLASRLCGVAGNNQFVVSSRIWEVLQHVMVGWTITPMTHRLKGFSKSINTVHIEPRSVSANSAQKCTICGSTIVIYRTPEGFLDMRCVNFENHETITEESA